VTPAALRAWRECMGYTQQQAAQALGVSLRTVKAWEAGFAAPPAFLALACAALAAGLWPWATSCRPALPQSGCSRPAPAPDCATRRRGKIPDLLL